MPARPKIRDGPATATMGHQQSNRAGPEDWQTGNAGLMRRNNRPHVPKGLLNDSSEGWSCVRSAVIAHRTLPKTRHEGGLSSEPGCWHGVYPNRIPYVVKADLLHLTAESEETPPQQKTPVNCAVAVFASVLYLYRPAF